VSSSAGSESWQRMSYKRLYPRGLGVIAFVLLAAILCGEVTNHTDSGPVPPCGSATVPPFPDVDKSPIVKAWGRSGLGDDWTPPACIGWTTSGFTTLVVTVALFRHSYGVEGLLRRIGAISELAGMRYWSTTHKRWQKLIAGAYALTGPAGSRRRNDFPPDEIATGKYLYFQQEDNLSGKAIYRMRIQRASSDRLVFDTENISAMRYLMWPLFRPGELQSIYFLERESVDVWRYYSISRTGRNASGLTGGHDASSINRAVAFYRYLAGIPTDQEPPASP
jgi:hypothetical protein